MILAHTYPGLATMPLDWNSFSIGFGDVATTYWLGNAAVNLLTTTDSYKLRVDMWDSSDLYDYAEFQSILVKGETDNYLISLGSLTEGTNGDGDLEAVSGSVFATSDRDTGGCATTTGAAWWYNASLTGCTTSRIIPDAGKTGIWTRDGDTQDSFQKDLYKVMARIVSTSTSKYPT